MADSTDALPSPTATATKGKSRTIHVFAKVPLTLFSLGTKREAEIEEVSPTKLKALKASNGTNGEAPTVIDDDSSNHKNGDEHYHDEEDDDDDDVSSTNESKATLQRRNEEVDFVSR